MIEDLVAQHKHLGRAVTDIIAEQLQQQSSEVGKHG